MAVIVASFNVENMFRRPIAFNQSTWAQGKPILEAFSAFQLLLEQPTYSNADKKAILKHLKALGLLKSDEGPMVILRRSRGQLVRRPRTGPVEVIASGRGDWIGWLELKREAVNELATRNTARVIGDIQPDVLCIVEAEDRPALCRFNEDVFGFEQAKRPAKKDRWTFEHILLVDGNDDRGIDVGLMTRRGHRIESVRSHVDDVNSKGETIFSRDCPEFVVVTPQGNRMLVMVNHFKSKGFGDQADNNRRRRAQARRVAALYAERRADGFQHVLVAGDLNDEPDSGPLKALLQDTDLKDVSTLGPPAFDDGGRTGTFKGTSTKFDYLLCSPALLALVKKAAIFRKGVWRGAKTKNPWPIYDTMTAERHAASDHAAIWAEVALS
jgi:endonuclease/exonuclease/phosphatase family metal-dependent hydrolase